MAYQSAYRSSYRRHRRRRRNSHYGVLIALILLVVIAVPVIFRMVTGAAGALFGGGSSQIVYQLQTPRALMQGKTVDLGGTPYRDQSGSALVPMQSLCENMDMDFAWDAAAGTATATRKKDTVQMKAGSKNMLLNGEKHSMSVAADAKDGVLYVPVRDFCTALSWQSSELGADQGDLIVISQSKKPLDEDKIGKAAEEALAVLGPSEQQLAATSVLLRADSDKLLSAGETVQMSEEEGKRGKAALDRGGMKYVPLKAAVHALGGTASFDGKHEWTVDCSGLQSTVQDDGKTKVNGEKVKGDHIDAYQDEASGSFYVSAPVFAAVIGKHFTDLGDGAFAFTTVSLDGFDSQKAYLDSLKEGLTQAVGGNIPEADVYIALTFDDGPTGRTGEYPEGLTATLLDGLKERGAHATFFMCGYRLQDFNSHCSRYLAEGHELGNHTMNHPMSMLPALGEDEIRKEINDNNDLIEKYCGARPTVMRPVGGAYDDKVQAVMKELGLPIINWDADTLDWKTKTDPSSVKNNLIDLAKDGSIVLMHDMYTGTVQGVLQAIDELQSRTDKTYAFVTVSELAAVKGITLEPGKVYTNIKESAA